MRGVSLHKITVALLFASFCSGQSLRPEEVLDQYLTSSGDGQPECSGWVFALQIDASLPKLKKQASMTGFEVISQTRQITYHDLRFTGDNLVKRAVISRFLVKNAEPPQVGGVGVTRQNYFFHYEKTSDYNGQAAFVFRLKPKHKRVGLFNGELWIDASTAAPFRVWGDFVKSPSVFIRSLRVVQDYQLLTQCSAPIRLIVTAKTRIAGEADMVAWLHSAGSDERRTN